MKRRNLDLWTFSKRERHAILFILLVYLTTYAVRGQLQRKAQEEIQLKEKVYAPLLAFLPAIRDTLEPNDNHQKISNRSEKMDYSKPFTKDTTPDYRHFSPKASTYLKGPSRIEINTADSAEWTSLPGIGDYMTKSILNYRNALGGFCSIDQLKNMKQMRPETFEKIAPFVWCDKNKIVPLAINTLDAFALSKNPHLTYAQAKTIVAYREKHGPFTSFESIEKMGILDDLTINSLRPYLAATFEQAAKNEPIR